MIDAGKYLMWELQSQFRVHAEMSARAVFRELDVELRPRISLVGLLQSHRTDRYPLCIEPDNEDFSPKDFRKLLTVHDRLGRLVVSNAYTKGRSELQKQHEQLRQALLESVTPLSAARGKVVFCSRPSTLGHYLVFTLIELTEQPYRSHFRLPRKLKGDGITSAISLIDSAIEEFLDECTGLLARSEDGFVDRSFRSAGELLRAAGRNLINSVSGSSRDLFQSSAKITSLKYEGQEGSGQIIVCGDKHPNIKLDLSFLTPIPISYDRAVRKLLQLSSGGLSLISDGDKILGLGRVVNVEDYVDQDLFFIRFTQLHIWEFCYYDQVLMTVSYGVPAQARNQFDAEKFEEDLRRIFPRISVTAMQSLTDGANVALTQKRGTMLVISSQAKQEAERLDKQCYRIRPTQLNFEVLQTATEIDGAILLDTDAQCHAIGVILDGKASKHGTSARGARFNSAVRYIDSSKEPCLAVVISEDGNVDIIPDLLPEEQQGRMDTILGDLRSMATTRVIDAAKFYRIMDWFDAHRSYLMPELCDELNRLQAEIERALPTDTQLISYPEFVSEGKLH